MTPLRDRRLRRWLLLLAPLALFLGCGDGTGPATSPDARPAPAFRALQLSSGAPPLAATEVSFWARYDEDREVKLYFRPKDGSSDSTEFMVFKVPARSILRDATGRTFGGSDSVRITVTVPDPSRFEVRFAPSGLQFSQLRPARLTFELAERDDDLDDDGDVDDDDDVLRADLWKQEAPGSVWRRIASLVIEELDEIEAEIFDFTGYAVAI